MLTSLLRLSIVRGKKPKDRQLACLCFLGLSSIVLAWTSQLSVGWPLPFIAFGNLLVVVGMVTISQEGEHTWMLQKKTKAFVYCLLLLSICMTFYRVEALQWNVPYRDQSRSIQNCNLASLFPRFGNYLYTNQTTCQRFRDLKTVLSDLDSTLRVVVMPEFPLIYYLSDRRNPVGVDWWYTFEYLPFAANLEEQLRFRSDVVLLEGKPSEQACSKGLHGGPLEKWVSSHFILSKRVGSFCLFVNPSRTATKRG